MSFSNGTIALLVTLSGISSLIYQVIWDRMLKYHFGGDSISSAIVAGTFMLGLGIGAFLFGRVRRRPLLVYAAVELGIGFYGLASYSILVHLAAGLTKAFPFTIESVENVRYLVMVGSIGYLLVPCTLMGGTLPLMFRCFVSEENNRVRRVGWIYGLNTLGAAIGILFASYGLLNHLPLPTILQLIASLNAIVSILLFSLWMRQPKEVGHAKEVDSPIAARWYLLSFLTGWIVLGFETILFRFFSTFNKSSPYNYPSVVFIICLALASGSFLFTQKPSKTGSPRLKLLGLFAFGGLSLVLATWMNWELLQLLPTGRKTGVPLPFLISLPLLFLMPLLIAGIFPNIMALAAPRVSGIAQSSGKLYVVNSLGSFLGALLIQFVGYQWLGTEGVMALLVILCFVGAWIVAASHLKPAHHVGVLLVLAFTTSVLWRWQGWTLFKYGRHAAHYMKNSSSLDSSEGETGISYIRWNPNSLGEVFVNSVYMAAIPESPRHLEQLAVAFLKPRRERILVLGLGGGNYLKNLLKDPAVQSIEVVDWSHELPKVLSSPRSKATMGDLLNHPKVKMRLADARVAVRLYPEKSFDLILDNLAFSSWAGATNIKSVEYYQMIRRLLHPQGLFLYGANFANARVPNLSALLRVFPVVKENPEFESVLCALEPPSLEDPAHNRFVAEAARNYGGDPMQFIERLKTGYQAVNPVLSMALPIQDHVMIFEYHQLQSQRFVNWWYRYQ